jgi:hypothetical protein
MDTELRETIELGAAWLDERLPGWAQAINLERLELDSSCGCVLGQLAEDLPGAVKQPTTSLTGPWTFWSVVASWGDDHPLTLQEAIDMGFMRECEEDWTWRELTEAWREFVTARRS